MQFRPCIDLHQGKVKQIVGGTLSDAAHDSVQTNFEAEKPAQWYAQLYRKLRGTPDEIPWAEYDRVVSERDKEIRAAIAEKEAYYVEIDEMIPELNLVEEIYIDDPDVYEEDRRQIQFRGSLLREYFGKELPWNGNPDYAMAEPWDGQFTDWRPE